MPSSFTLKMRDVLHFAPPDTDPNEHIIPSAFPPNSANPMSLTFTSLGFRDFWRQERRAYDWEYRARKFTDWYKSKPKGGHLDLPLPDKSELALAQDGHPGPRIQYDWTVRYNCRCWRTQSKITRGQIPVGTNCGAYVFILKTLGQDEIAVEYHWCHNHPTSDQERVMLPCSRYGREWIKENVSQGHNWLAIKKRLRPNEELLQEVCGSLMTSSMHPITMFSTC